MGCTCRKAFDVRHGLAQSLASSRKHKSTSTCTGFKQRDGMQGEIQAGGRGRQAPLALSLAERGLCVLAALDPFGLHAAPRPPPPSPSLPPLPASPPFRPAVLLSPCASLPLLIVLDVPPPGTSMPACPGYELRCCCSIPSRWVALRRAASACLTNRRAAVSSSPPSAVEASEAPA